MNNKRRLLLQEALRCLQRSLEIVSSVKDDEDDALFNMPENLQSGDRYEKIENAVSSLEDAEDNISSAIDSIESASE